MAAVLVRDAVVVLFRLDRDVQRVARLVPGVGDPVGAGGEVGTGADVVAIRNAVAVVVRLGTAVIVVERVKVLLHVAAVRGDSVVGEAEEPAIGARAADGALAEVADAVEVVVRLGAAVRVLVAVDVLRNERAGVAAADDPVVVDVVRAAVGVLEAVVVFGEGRALVAAVGEGIVVHIGIAGVAEAVAVGVGLVADERATGLRRPVGRVRAVVGACAKAAGSAGVADAVAV